METKKPNKKGMETALTLNILNYLYSNPHTPYKHNEYVKERNQYFCSYRGIYKNTKELKPTKSNHYYLIPNGYSLTDVFGLILNTEMELFGNGTTYEGSKLDKKIRYKTEYILDFLTYLEMWYLTKGKSYEKPITKNQTKKVWKLL